MFCLHLQEKTTLLASFLSKLNDVAEKNKKSVYIRFRLHKILLKESTRYKGIMLSNPNYI